MARIAKRRFITFTEYTHDTPRVLTEMEYFQQVTLPGKTLDDICESGEYADFIWQWALSKSDAIAQHESKLDCRYDHLNAGHAEKRTY